MRILDLIETDFVNYKKTCMTVMFPYCTFKCNTEAGRIVCQNYQSREDIILDISVDEVLRRYLNNPMSEAIVMQGLEPFDSFGELIELIKAFSDLTDDDIVIYTGYREDEIIDRVSELISVIKNNKLIIKFGRFIPDINSRYDEILGVTLQSDNQYAKVLNR